MKQLGTLTLPDDLIWQNRYAYVPIAAQTERALDGSLILYEQDIAGEPVDLIAFEDSGWFTFSQVQSLLQMASLKGAEYTLIYEGETHNVRFRNEDPPSVDMKPILEIADDHQSGDYFFGTIKLIKI